MTVREAIAHIKERTGIVDLVQRYVDLKPNGSRWIAPCPFHQETRSSFFVFPDKGTFYCFGCQASGDVLDFYSLINGLEFHDTIVQLSEELGIEVEFSRTGKTSPKNSQKIMAKKNLMLALYEAVSNFYQASLQKKEARLCNEYIRQRGLSPAIQKYFQIGYAPGNWHALKDMLINKGYDLEVALEAGLIGKSDSGKMFDRFRDRLIFPIKNLGGQTIAFGGRIIKECDEAKYINSADSPVYKKGEQLFGLFQARKAIIAKNCAFLTEGYMDVLTLHQFNYPNAAGVLGTALTPGQIKRIAGFTSRVVLLFDGDNAGRKAAFRSCEMLLSCGLACEVALMPEGEDIDSLLRTKGCDFFNSLLKNSVEGFKYCIDVLSQMAPKEALAWARNFIGNIAFSELVSGYISKLAMHLHLSEEELRNGHLLKSEKKSAFAERHSSGVQEKCAFANKHEEQILIVAVRYPELIEEIRNLGADLLLSSACAKNFWETLSKNPGENMPYILNNAQKDFWHKYRGPCSPPLLSGDAEFLSLKKLLENHFSTNQKTILYSALAASSQGTDTDHDMEYLRMLQQTLETNHEQS